MSESVGHQGRQRLGEILVKRGVITRDRLTQALQTQRTHGRRLGETLRTMGVSSQHIAEAMSEQLGLPLIRAHTLHIPAALLRLIPEHLARSHQGLPISATGSRVTVALVDPFDVMAVDDIRRLTGRDVDIAIISADDFEVAVTQYFSVDRAKAEAVGEMPGRAAREPEIAPDQLRQMVDEAPIVRLVSQMITQAVRQRASDIHIETQEKELRVRFRIDGLLSTVMTPARHLQPAVISRIKILAGMDIAEQRLPQDGRIQAEAAEKAIDIRVSTIPTVYGENVVLRLLGREPEIMRLDQLGLSPHDKARVESIVKHPNGVFLMTGPTGSGKTTTLYSILNMLNAPDRKIVTIEDPVEYHIPGVSQVQVNPKTHLTFAGGLRSFLRHDPDIIMVGEIRDSETAAIAVQAALTGHLVLSTLHTNDAPGAITRLLDMGVEPYLLASTLLAAGAQRLVRVLCPECKEAIELEPEMADRLGISLEDGPVKVYGHRGCSVCNDRGYWGRTAIFEVMRVRDDMRTSIVLRTPEHELRTVATRDGMHSLLEDGVRKVLAGITSTNELLRILETADDGRPEPSRGAQLAARRKSTPN